MNLFHSSVIFSDYMIIILYYLELSAAAINLTFEKQEPVNIWLLC